MKYVSVLFFAAAVAGCGGPAASGPGPKTAADETAPPPPSEEQVKKAQEEQQTKAAPAPGKPAAPVVSASARKPFDEAVAKWEAAKKAGTDKKDCASLASAFEGAASKELAAQAHFNAGTILDACGRDKDAESHYQDALKANPGYAPAINNLGEIYLRRNNPTTAKGWFERAIQADPTHIAPAYTNLALLIYQQAKESGDKALLKEAVSKLRRALAIDSDDMAAYNLLGLIYLQTAENDRSKLKLAELVCDQAKLSSDSYAPIYHTLGLIRLRQKNVTGALKEFEKAIQLDANYTEAHLNIGAIALSTRQYDKAELSFRQVLKLQENNIDATIGLGVALRGQRKYDEAEQMYKKAQELDPKNCAVAYNLGLLYQDYKSSEDNSTQRQAQKFYNQYASCSRTEKSKVADAQRRIKDIDDLFAALEQQKKMEAEVKAMQEEAERQQKQMEEQMKQQQQQQQQQNPPKAEGGEASPKK